MKAQNNPIDYEALYRKTYVKLIEQKNYVLHLERLLQTGETHDTGNNDTGNKRQIDPAGD